MRNRIVNVLMLGFRGKHPFPYSGLQLFADGGDGGGTDDGSGGGGDPDGDEGGNGGTDDDNQTSFDDFLSQKGNQEEFDKRVQEAVNKAVSAAKTKWQALTDDKLSEAEKLAKMTKEERAEYVRQKERQEFEAERAAFERDKLLVEITKELQSQSLPVVFADSLVNISDAEKIKDAITGIKKAWDLEIAGAVKSKARQATPQEGGQVIGSRQGLPSIREMARKNRIIKN